MRKRFRVMILAAIVAAVVVPVGFALSLDSAPAGVVAHARAAVAPSSPIVALGSPTVKFAAPMIGSVSPLLPMIPDGARLFFAGTVLFGLAAVLKKTV